MTFSAELFNVSAAKMRLWIKRSFQSYAAGLMRRSEAIASWLARHSNVIFLAWLAVFSVAAAIRLLFPATPIRNAADLAETTLPYVLIALAPIAGFKLAAASFPIGMVFRQPEYRFARYGRWRQASVTEARRSPIFGPAGFMASLLVGLLLNVGFRSFEFLLAMPPVNHHGPDWAVRLFLLMTFDVVVMSFFYMVCFVMALRTNSFFPRMLLFAWALDICMQLTIARQLAMMHDLPAQVAAPLKTLLDGNIKKVLISAFVWVPYLLLSDRVNLTYRQRLRKGEAAQGNAPPSAEGQRDEV